MNHSSYQTAILLLETVTMSQSPEAVHDVAPPVVVQESVAEPPPVVTKSASEPLIFRSTVGAPTAAYVKVNVRVPPLVSV